MRTLALITLFSVAATSAAATIFFAYFGVRIVHAVVTFEGEGSLGHVGMYIAAGLYPLLALLCGWIALAAWRAFRRRLVSARPDDGASRRSTVERHD